MHNYNKSTFERMEKGTGNYWRWYRNYLMCLASTQNIYSTEYKNLIYRIKWINNNRL